MRSGEGVTSNRFCRYGPQYPPIVFRFRNMCYMVHMDEVMEAFTEAMKTAGFGEEAEEPPKNGGKKTKAATE